MRAGPLTPCYLHVYGRGRRNAKPVRIVHEAHESEPVILVGHSFGGIVITQAAEYRPEKIQSLVYVSAILPEHEHNLIQMAQKYSLPPSPIILSEDKTYAQLDPAVVHDLFYGECSEKDAAEAKEKLGPQPLLPDITPVRITDDRFGRVPRVYIETSPHRRSKRNVHNHPLSASHYHGFRSLPIFIATGSIGLPSEKHREAYHPRRVPALTGTIVPSSVTVWNMVFAFRTVTLLFERTGFPIPLAPCPSMLFGRRDTSRMFSPIIRIYKKERMDSFCFTATCSY
jgi:pimeloyl-ACP methyl ester carboxylesterase